MTTVADTLVNRAADSWVSFRYMELAPSDPSKVHALVSSRQFVCRQREELVRCDRNVDRVADSRRHARMGTRQQQSLADAHAEAACWHIV